MDANPSTEPLVLSRPGAPENSTKTEVFIEKHEDHGDFMDFMETLDVESQPVHEFEKEDAKSKANKHRPRGPAEAHTNANTVTCDY